MKKPTPPRRPIVADKRYTEKAKPAGKPATSAKPGKRRAKRGRGARGGNVVVRGVTGFFGLIWRVIWGSIWRLTAVVTLIVGAASFYFYTTLPEASALLDGRARGSVTMLDREGRTFAWRGETFGNVGFDEIAPVLKDAVVATEDKRFYSHFGISPRGIASAIRINMAEGRGPLEGNGGSTITQQVAKLLCLGETFDPTRWESEADYEADCRKNSIWRKVKEIPFSFAMEAKYSKDEILSIYMNRAYLGAGARGFEAASERYFGKHANTVNAAESAMLAGLLKAPSRFAPTANLQRSQDRANVILGLMHDQGYLSDAEFQEATTNPAVLSKAAADRAGGYFADWVMESGPAFLTTETTEDVTVLTTFDQRIQRAAERALAKTFEEKVSPGSKAQAAVVVMSADGAVRAMVGGRDTTVNGAFNRATQARRQTGSSFKPFVYAAALDMGYNPNTLVEDAPLTINVRGSGPWSPKNYTRNFLGQIPMWQALAKSINTSTIRIQEAVGRDNVRRVAEDFGVASDLANGPSLGLGASESTLLEMTSAYSGIRNRGRAVRPYGLVELRIAGDDQPLIGQTGGTGKQVISEKAAAELTWMMKQVIEKGTGGRARLDGREAAGKTGTTSSYRDAWFIGFTEQYVVGVWMGYDDNTPLKGVTGGGLPAEIWKSVMEAVHEGLPAEPLSALSPTGAGGYLGAAATPDQVVGDDPLAAALSEALGGAPAPAPAQAPAGRAPVFSGETQSSSPGAAQGGQAQVTPADGGSGGAGEGEQDALDRALQEAMRGGG